MGCFALHMNTNSGGNVAIGPWALASQSNANGGTLYYSNNVAVGYASLQINNPTTSLNGANNTGLGYYSLHGNTTGSNNIGIGTFAGQALTSGDYNIPIGSEGVAAEANTIRLGTPGSQNKTFTPGSAG